MKKILSVVLSVALAIGIMPMNALAEGIDRVKNAELSEAVVTSEQSHWAADAADELISSGIMTDELAEMTSNLDGSATRAQAVSLLVKSVKNELTEGNPKEKDNADDSTVENQIKLSDISGHWAEEYIKAAIAAGYVNGYPDGTFRPDDTITRAEIAKITAVAMGLEAKSEQNPFNDLSESGWSYKYVMACYDGGLLKGYADGSFRADGQITCGESIAICARANEAVFGVDGNVNNTEDDNKSENNTKATADKKPSTGNGSGGGWSRPANSGSGTSKEDNENGSSSGNESNTSADVSGSSDDKENSNPSGDSQTEQTTEKQDNGLNDGQTVRPLGGTEGDEKQTQEMDEIINLNDDPEFEKYDALKDSFTEEDEISAGDKVEIIEYDEEDENNEKEQNKHDENEVILKGAAPGAPTITKPTSTWNTTDIAYGATVTFKWTAVSGTKYYMYSVKNETTGKSVAYNQKVNSANALTFSGLAAGNKYKFAVGAYNSDGGSNWSYCYARIGYPAGKVTITKPTTEGKTKEVDYGSDITFGWDKASNVSYYRYSILDQTSGEYITRNSELSSSTRSIKLNYSGTEPGHTYKFAIGAYNEAGKGDDWSCCYARVKDQTYQTLTIKKPANNGSYAAEEIRDITWNDIKANYYVCSVKNNTKDKKITLSGTCVDSIEKNYKTSNLYITVPSGSIDPGCKYTVWVAGYNASKKEISSDTNIFYVAPETPEISSPKENETIAAGKSVKFTWSSEGASRYKYTFKNLRTNEKYCASGDKADSNGNVTVSRTYAEFTASQLIQGDSYTFGVGAYSAYGKGSDWTYRTITIGKKTQTTGGNSGKPGVENNNDNITAVNQSGQNSASSESDPIDLSTGAQVIDLSFLTQSTVADLSLKLSYNSLLLDEGTMGKGWGHNYEISLNDSENGDKVINWTPNRRNTMLKSDGTWKYNDSTGLYTLKSVSGGYKLTNPSKTSYNFNSNGVLQSISDKNGNSVIFTYSNGKLSAATDSLSGTKLMFEYGSDGLVSKVCDSFGRSVAMSYTNRYLSQITDELNIVRKYTYNSTGQTLSGTKDGKPVFTNTIDENWRVISQDDGVDGNGLTTISYSEDLEKGTITTVATDRNGNKRTVVHDSKYRLLKSTDKNGATTEYEYYANGLTKSVKDSLGRKVSYEYDANCNLIKAVDVCGEQTIYSYDKGNNLTEITNPDGTSISYTYDDNGNVKSCTDALKKTVNYEYNANGMITEVQNPLGASDKYEYNSKGQLAKYTSAAGVCAEYEYDAMGRVEVEKNAAGAEVRYTYDAAGKVLSVTDALGNTAYTTYDYNGNVLTVKDAAGNVTKNAYDGNGNLISVTNALGQTISYTYDGEGNLISTTDARGNVSTLTLDKNGNVLESRDALGNVVKYTYDSADRLKKTVDSYGNVTAKYTYDARDNVLTVTDADGNVTKSSYDNYGKLMSVSDPKNNVTKFRYDKLGRLIELTDAEGANAAAEYDSNGNLLKYTSASGTTAQYTYNAAGQMLTQSTANKGLIRFAYNQLGQTAEISNARGQKSEIYYDKVGRISKVIEPGGNEILYSYDNVGNLLKIGGKWRNISREYDALGRVIKYTDADGNALLYKYDQSGNMTEITYPNGKAVRYSYDAANRMTSVTDWDGNRTEYSYDKLGRVVKTVRPNGTVLDNTYNELGQLTHRKDYNPRTNKVIYEVSLTYDEVGNILSETSNMQSVGDIVNAQMSYSDSNLLTEYNGVSVEYDADGNMLALPYGDRLGLGYDYKNRLVYAGGSSYTYDAEGNRIKLTEWRTTTEFVINPTGGMSQVISRTKGGRTVYYIYGYGMAYELEGSEMRTYHFDVRGSTVAISGSTGAVTDTVKYGAYGKVTARTGRTETPFLYCGAYGVQTDENGLLYMRARYYSPELMRFLSEDTVVGSLDKVGSLNRYAFCGGNPVNYIDAGGNIPTALEAAYMAQHIYGDDPTLIGGWEQAEDYLINVDGGMRMGYYYRTIDGVTEYAVVNKGTYPASVSDWANNVLQLDGKSWDLSESIAMAIAVSEAFKDSEVTFIGHSKGGAEAYANAIATNRSCITFNPAGLSLTSGGAALIMNLLLDENDYDASMTAYVVDGEILDISGVANLGIRPKIIRLPRQSWNPITNHDIKSVIAGLKGKNY